MSKQKTIAELKAKMKALADEIKKKENEEAIKIGQWVQSATGQTELSGIIKNYKLIKIEEGVKNGN